MANEQSVLAVIRATRPSFRNAHDKVAFAVHAAFLASGYVLHATGPPAFSDTAFSSTSTDEVGIDNWNEFEDDYAFLYSNPEKGSKKVLVKCLAMNEKLLVDAIRDGGAQPAHVELSVDDYDKENGGTNYGSQYKDLEKLVNSVDKEILCKVNGITGGGSSSAQPSSSTQPPSFGTRDVEVPAPQNPQPTVRFPYPAVNPVGGSDLFPGPGAGMYPTRGDSGMGGGMLVGPDNLLFGGVGRGMGPGMPGGLLGVPPGARFDPYGPPGVPGLEPNRFVRDPRRPPGTHPDLEHFPDGSDFI
ncbi:hypothetical protein NMG60_11002518 [Bertholletia excelsa]